jgi:hypothetical protein
MADTDFATALLGTFNSPGGNAAAIKSAVTASLNLASQAEAEAAAENTKPMTAARVKQQIDVLKADFAEVVTDTYVLTAADNQKFRVLTDPDGVGLVLHDNIPAGFAATYIQGGDGQITFSAAAGGTMHQEDGFTHSRKKWSTVTAAVLSNAGGSAAVWILIGSMEA